MEFLQINFQLNELEKHKRSDSKLNAVLKPIEGDYFRLHCALVLKLIPVQYQYHSQQK